jgi:hypothetical protein
MGGLLTDLSQPGADSASPLSPPASWRRDQAFGLGVGVVFGLTGGVVFGLVAGLGFKLMSNPVAGFVAGLGVGVVVGLVSRPVRGFVVALATGRATGLGVELATGLAYPETWAASLAFVQLARRWHTPVRLMRFLEDARQREVLRTVGPVYQFRHARLQDRLAGQANTAVHQERQAAGTAL